MDRLLAINSLRLKTSRVDLISWIQLMEHTSPGCGINGTDLVGCVTSLDWYTSSLRDPSPQALTLLGGVRFIAWRLRRPFLGEWRRGPRHLWECRGCLGYGPAPWPTVKRPCATLVHLVEGATNTVDLISWLIFGLIFLRLTIQHFDPLLFLVSSHVNCL